MKTTCRSSLLALALILTAVIPLWTAVAQATAFMYEGRLSDGGSPANGTYDLTFSLFHTPSNGAAAAGPIAGNPPPATNGVFPEPLDFRPRGLTGPSYLLPRAVRT